MSDIKFGKPFLGWDVRNSSDETAIGKVVRKNQMSNRIFCQINRSQSFKMCSGNAIQDVGVSNTRNAIFDATRPKNYVQVLALVIAQSDCIALN